MNTELNVIESCEGCGVCCLHMGYPAFLLPRPKYSKQEIATNPDLQQMLGDGWTEEELLAGYEGESYWQTLPSDLKQEWQKFVAGYKRPGELDGPCFWFDMETGQCRHHEVRPRVCRDFETGSKECLEWRREYRELVK